MTNPGHNGQSRATDNLLAPEQEVWIARLARGSVVAFIALHLAALAFLLISQARQPWHYAADAAAVASLLIVGLALAAYNLHRHLESQRRLQARLLMRAVELQEAATRDDLTQLHNRRYFYEGLQKNLEQARNARRPLALLLVDVDNLKAINDNYGHQVGDVVLKNLAQIITKHVRAGDVVARLGGDEFGIVMPDTDKRGAFSLARRLWQALEERPIYQEGDASFHLNVSIGVSGYPWRGDSVDQMIHWADTDMYANKVSRRLPLPPLRGEEIVPDIEAAPSEYE